MTRARELASSDLGIPTGFRNKIINGDFSIWQRGTSFNGTGYNYTADRWMGFRGSFAAGMTMTRVTGPTGFTYGIRIQRDSGNTATNAMALQQTFESANSIPLAGDTVTLSFYTRIGANFSPSSLKVFLYTGEGTDQAANAMNYAWTNPQTYSKTILTGNLSTSWTRQTFTVTLSSSMKQFGLQFYIDPVGTAGANDWYEIAGVQLEIGSVATPFENRPIGTELALCQRYYEKNTISFSAQPMTSSNITSVLRTIYFAVDKRVSPSVSVSISNIDNCVAGNGLITFVSIRHFTHTQEVSLTSFPYNALRMVYETSAEL